ncbi:MAG: NfeD family protein [Bacilli bacterium]|nr:NfeD family protein [Bacilli bacterium]
MVWIWLGIVIVLTLLELATVNLVTVWFIASAIVSLILSIFVDSFFIQFLVFVILGTILLITTRDYLLKWLGNKKEKTNLDRVIGMEAIVTEEIGKNKPGEVKVDGKRWTAVANKKIKVNSTVKVLEINGVKLKVEEVKD